MSTHITLDNRGGVVTYVGSDAAYQALRASDDLHVTTVDSSTVKQLVAMEGGTGRIAEQMGYVKGTREYKSAQRAIQRHQKGVKPTGAWKGRYEDILKPEGTVTITVEGEIEAYAGSDDVRDRPVKSGTIRGNVLDILRNPLQAWRDDVKGGGFNPVVKDMGSITVTYARY